MQAYQLKGLGGGDREAKVFARLDELEWCAWHWKVTLVLGLGWAFDAFETTIVTGVLPVMMSFFGVSAGMASAIPAVWLMGAMIGALGSGYIADRYGRKFTFMATMLLYSVMTLASACAPGFEAFLILRFLTAIGVGAEYVAVNVAICELIPKKYRGQANAAVMGFWGLGALVAHGIQVLLMQRLNEFWVWRVGLALGSFAAIYLMAVRHTLVESPRWLVSRGRIEEAEAAVTQIEMLCGQPTGPMIYPDPLVCYPPPPSLSQALAMCLKHAPLALGMGMCLNATQAFADYGVSSLMALRLLANVNVQGFYIPQFFLLGVMCMIPGYLYIFLLIDVIGRKPLLPLQFLLCIGTVIIMSQCTNPTSLTMAHCFFQFSYASVMGLIYPIISESFPTTSRGIGLGISVACGRLVAAFAPPILLSIQSNFSFLAIAASLILGLISSLIFCAVGTEGKRAPLPELSISIYTSSNANLI